MEDYKTELGKIADIRVGYQARGRIEEDVTGDFIIIRPQDIDELNNLNLEKAMHFQPSSKIDPTNAQVTQNEILFQSRGLKNKVCLIDLPLQNTVASNTFYVIKIRDLENVLPEYLAWWFEQPVLQRYFEQGRGISTIPFISTKVLSHAPIMVPPLATQEKICNLVRLLKREQAVMNDLIRKKEIMIHAVAREAVKQASEDKQWQKKDFHKEN